MAEWFRFKYKTPEVNSSVMVCYHNKSSGERTTQSIRRVNEYQINTFKESEEKTHQYWWRYLIDTDFPPKSIEVGDVLVSKTDRTRLLTVLAKHGKEYFVLNSTPDYEVTSIYLEKDILESYERKE